MEVGVILGPSVTLPGRPSTEKEMTWHQLIDGIKQIKIQQVAVFIPIRPDSVSWRHTLHLIASHFYMNEENEVSSHEFLS